MLTSIGSTGWLRRSFRTGRSSRCIVVTSPSLNIEENLQRRQVENIRHKQDQLVFTVFFNLRSSGMRRSWDREDTDLPARPAICRDCDVLMNSICFSPFSLTLGFIRELKMIRFILLKRSGENRQTLVWAEMCYVFTIKPQMQFSLCNSNTLNSCDISSADDAYRLRPMPIASVATRILQGSSGSLNFLAWDSLVPEIQI